MRLKKHQFLIDRYQVEYRGQDKKPLNATVGVYRERNFHPVTIYVADMVSDLGETLIKATPIQTPTERDRVCTDQEFRSTVINLLQSQGYFRVEQEAPTPQ